MLRIVQKSGLSFRRYSGYNEVGGAGEGGLGRGTAEGGGGGGLKGGGTEGGGKYKG